MCISCGIECFGRCGCNEPDNEVILNEIEKDYKRGYLSDVEVKKQAQELLDCEEYEKFLEDLGIE